jgi:CLIP-associating protein 1/2
VITVLVIAESADNCIKTVMDFYYYVQKNSFKCYSLIVSFLASQMLRNCKVARVLPRIADCAKNDRAAVLRAR